MSKVVYITYNPFEGVMATLGMEIMTIQKKDDFSTHLRALKKQNILVVFVSEEVYVDYQKVISQYDKEFEFSISVLANQLNTHNIGKSRFAKLIEDTVGIKVN